MDKFIPGKIETRYIYILYIYIYIYIYHGAIGFLSLPFPTNIPHVLESLHLLTNRNMRDIQEEFERIYIRVNAYHKNKSTSKIKQQPSKPLCHVFQKNSQCTIIKKGIVSVAYVEDKKDLSQFKQTAFQWMHLCGTFLSQPSLNFCNLY